MPSQVSNILTLPVSKTTLQLGQSFFTQHYSSVNQPNTNFAKNITTPLTDLMAQVSKAASDNNIPLAQLVVRFIHRYDAGGTNQWFLCAECGKMDTTGVENMGYTTYPVTMFPASRFDILADGTIQSPSTLPAGDFDPGYAGSLLYTESGATAAIDTSKHVMSHVFPWQCEILSMVSSNGIDTANVPDGMNIVFASYTALYPIQDHLCAVGYPHGLAIYLNDGTNDLLDDMHYVSVFHCKGANYSSLWPPSVNAYNWSFDLPKCS